MYAVVAHPKSIKAPAAEIFYKSNFPDQFQYRYESLNYINFAISVPIAIKEPLTPVRWDTPEIVRKQKDICLSMHEDFHYYEVISGHTVAVQASKGIIAGFGLSIGKDNPRLHDETFREFSLKGGSQYLKHFHDHMASNGFFRELINLTPRQKEILILDINGFSNAEIARELGIRPNTVRNHLQNVHRKLKASHNSPGQAALKALLYGILDMDSMT